MFNRLAELREKRANGDKGFTLIELLVVVVIIGILIAIAIPLYLNYRKGANDKAAQSDVRGAISALEQCMSDNSQYPTSATFPGNACTGQNVNTSSGTTLNYIPNVTTGAATAYDLIAFNSGGNVTGGASGGYYCYASAAGGSVQKKTGAVPTTYSPAC
jgi:type IV pilus assembly protein PilA